MSESSTNFVFYKYNPSLPAAVVFIVLFLVSGGHHAFMVVQRRTWFLIPLLIGCIFEGVGYIGRAMSAAQAPNFTSTPYVVQSLLILLGPNFIAATIYMALGRLITLLEADGHSAIRPSRMTKIFVAGDVLSFLAQSGGGGILAQAKTQSDVSRGENIILGGLGIQILFFGLFMVATVVFHRRIGTRPTAASLALTRPWKELIWALHATSLLIMIRSLFRIAEYGQGRDGSLQSTEVFIYIFDATLMCIAALTFNYFHPSRVLGISSDPCDKPTEGYALEAPPIGQLQPKESHTMTA